MQYETKILTTKYQKPDSYGALSMPVYYTAAFEFESAKAMGDAFCGRSTVDWSRQCNGTQHGYDGHPLRADGCQCSRTQHRCLETFVWQQRLADSRHVGHVRRRATFC